MNYRHLGLLGCNIAIMKRFLLLLVYIIILNLIFLSSSFFAEEGYTFQKLYEVEVELESTDKNSINEGMGKALKELMVKLSGTSGVNVDQEIRKATSQPEVYISQYKLSSRNEKIIGTFSFNGESIRKLLSDNSLPLWIGIKPKILLFLPCEEQVGLIHQDKSSRAVSYTHLTLPTNREV